MNHDLFFDLWNEPTEFLEFIKTAPEVNQYHTGKYDMPSSLDFKKFLRGEKDNIFQYKICLDDIVSNEKINKINTNIVGYRPIISRVLSGNPYNMLSMHKREGQQLNMNVFLDMSVCADVSNGTIREIGQRVLATIERLELEGHSLGIIAGCTGTRFNESAVMAVRVKDIGEPLELTKLCYPLSNPGFLRKFNFYWHALHKEIPRLPGLGVPLNYNYGNDEISESFSVLLGQKTLFLPFTLFKGWDENKIFTYIKDKLNILNNTVFLE